MIASNDLSGKRKHSASLCSNLTKDESPLAEARWFASAIFWPL